MPAGDFVFRKETIKRAKLGAGCIAYAQNGSLYIRVFILVKIVQPFSQTFILVDFQ